MAVKLGEELSDSPKRMAVAAERPPIVWRCSLGLPPWIDRSVNVSPAVPPTSCDASALVLAHADAAAGAEDDARAGAPRG